MHVTSVRKPKWHHRLLGTLEDRRRVRDLMLRRMGLARSRVPRSLVGRDDLMIPNVVRGIAADMLLRQGNLSFAQVGAFDGSSDDDLSSLLRFENVRGLLVEPQPEPFAKLQEHFAEQPNVVLANIAIADRPGQREFYRPRHGESRLASFDRGNLLRHGVAASDIVSCPVPCLPLNQLLDEVGFERLDLLQIDAEGYDLQVLATLNLDRWQPGVLRFEYPHLPDRELTECLEGLIGRGYRFLVQQRDIVAYRMD